MQAFEKRELARRAAAVVGVDAGKFQHAMVIRPRGGADSKAIVFPTTRAGFDRAVIAIYDAARGIDGHILVGIEFAGMYGFTFAHYLHQREFHIQVVSVLAAHTKRWKEVTHRQPLKTDAKDALGITDLTAHGHFVAFPFLSPAYAELRYLLSAREKLSTLRKATITRLRASLDVVFPEFPSFFASPVAKTARALLRAYPGPAALCQARQRDVLAILKPDGFGPRLVRIRQARGLTQEELGALVGLSNRMIAYYEREDAQPPGTMLAPLARALKVTTDELLGLAPVTETLQRRTARLMKRLQQIEELPPAEQRAVLRMVDALLEHRRSAPAARARRKAS